MSVLIDTPIWSKYFRRKRPDPIALAAMKRLILEDKAVLIGPIRQEILTGIKDDGQFSLLRKRLEAVVEEPLQTKDYEEAARMSNLCRAAGIQGSPTDFLLCAVSDRTRYPVYTLDKDFVRYSEHLRIKLWRD